MVTHSDTCFLQTFLWERFKRIALGPVEFDVEMMKVVVIGVRKQKKSAPKYRGSRDRVAKTGWYKSLVNVTNEKE